MLWTIFAVVLILWLLGLGLHVAGGLIHLLLAVALVVLVVGGYYYFKYQSIVDQRLSQRAVTRRFPR